MPLGIPRPRAIHPARQFRGIPRGEIEPGRAQEAVDAREKVEDRGVGEDGRAECAGAAVVSDVDETGARDRVGDVRVVGG